MKKKKNIKWGRSSDFFLLTSNQVNIFVSTLVANVEDIFVSFVITKYENNYGFVLSSQFSPVTANFQNPIVMALKVTSPIKLLLP